MAEKASGEKEMVKPSPSSTDKQVHRHSGGRNMQFYYDKFTSSEPIETTGSNPNLSTSKSNKKKKSRSSAKQKKGNEKNPSEQASDVNKTGQTTETVANTDEKEDATLEEDEDEEASLALALKQSGKRVEQNKEEIDRWIERRRKMYPTKKNVEAKQRKQEWLEDIGSLPVSVLEVKMRKRLQIVRASEGYDRKKDKKHNRNRNSGISKKNPGQISKSAEENSLSKSGKGKFKTPAIQDQPTPIRKTIYLNSCCKVRRKRNTACFCNASDI